MDEQGIRQSGQWGRTGLRGRLSAWNQSSINKETLQGAPSERPFSARYIVTMMPGVQLCSGSSWYSCRLSSLNNGFMALAVSCRFRKGIGPLLLGWLARQNTLRWGADANKLLRCSRASNVRRGFRPTSRIICSSWAGLSFGAICSTLCLCSSKTAAMTMLLHPRDQRWAGSYRPLCS